jgi:putative ABC transport system permease protein
MSEYRRTRPRDWNERIFRGLLRLYPPAFREEYGDAMLEFFRDRVMQARTSSGGSGIGAVWRAALLDALRTAPLARADAVRRTLAQTWRLHFARTESDFLERSRRRDWMFISLLQDVRYALRGMRRTPAYTAVVIATLALGIGVNAAIFSVVRGVLLKPLPYRDPSRVLLVAQGGPYGTISEPEFADYQREAKSLSVVAAIEGSSASLTGGNAEPERVEVARVSEAFFDVLGVGAAAGRTFSRDESGPHGPLVAILSYGLWQRRFGGDRGIVGREVEINGRPRTVVGVMPRTFAYPAPDVSLWTPLRLNYDSLWDRNNHYLSMIGRLAPSADVRQVEVELNGMARRFAKDFPQFYPADAPVVVTALPLAEALTGNARPYLLALLGAVGFVLLIACVNIASLLLARGESRRKELAIRAAMGASRTRILRQMLTESLLQSAAGAGVGVALAWWSVRLLRASGPANLPRLDDIVMDAPVLLFTAFVAVLTGLFFGLAPSVRGAREEGAETLREGGKTSSASSRSMGRTRRRLVIVEVALAIIMLSGATLMVRSLRNLEAIDLGFNASNVLSMRISLPLPQYADDKAARFLDDLTQRLRSQPGVIAAGAVEDLPVADGNSIWSISLDGAPVTSVAKAPTAMPQKVTPEYFTVMRIPVLRGRAFTDVDRPDAPLVAVVNEAMVRKYWAGSEPLGHTVRMLNDKMPWATVVGVVKDVRSSGFLGDVPPTMYFPHAQAGRIAYYVPALMNVVIRTSGDPELVAGVARRIVRELEPNAPISRVGPMSRLVSDSVQSRRFSTQLLAGFALLALGLAGVGIYGVISYSVSQRSFEIGLRAALGARPDQVLRLIVGEGVRTTLIGAVIGLAGAVAVTRLMQSVFVQVSAWDPVSLGLATLLLVFVGAMASYLPARRALRVEPTRALRAE